MTTRVSDTIRSAALAFAGAAGALVIVWLAASAVFGWGLVVVVTGSMEPTVPAGSASITVPVAAADVAVGDIVTVPRDGGRPSVTHRVVDSAPVAADPAARELTLRGDANPTDDPDPYLVSEVQQVVVTIPGAGHVLWALRSPVAVGSMTLVVAALVVWAFWPERRLAAHRAPGPATRIHHGAHAESR